MPIHVTPAPGLAVPDPARGDLLPPEGRPVEPSQYWTRREADGDITLTPPAAPEKPATRKKD